MWLCLPTTRSNTFIQALVGSADLASKIGNDTLATTYATNATALKVAYNTLLWDASAGMYRDNDNSTLYAQDGNSLAVLFNLTQSPDQNTNISQGLTAFWTDIGPVTPELADTISPFVSGFEVSCVMALTYFSADQTLFL